MSSGYTPCACRDCMDAAVSSDERTPALCLLCEEAGCETYPPTEAEWRAYPVASAYECQRTDAYDIESDYENAPECVSDAPEYCDGSCR